jgi:hypothetical protein
VSDLALFDADDPEIVPGDPVPWVVPVCDWCGKAGPDVPMDAFTFRRYRRGDPWWPAVALSLIAIEEHKREGCEKRGEHPEELARLRDRVGKEGERDGLAD